MYCLCSVNLIEVDYLNIPIWDFVFDRVIVAVRAGQAVVPALPVTDTIKEMDPDDATRIARTVLRDRLRRVQTPQGFPREMLVEAHAAARREGWSATDDAALVEQAGGSK